MQARLYEEEFPPCGKCGVEDTGLGCLCDAAAADKRREERNNLAGPACATPVELLQTLRACLPPPNRPVAHDLWLPHGVTGLAPSLTSCVQQANIPSKIQGGKVVFLPGASLKAGATLPADAPLYTLLAELERAMEEDAHPT